jgi:hypothetical protein
MCDIFGERADDPTYVAAFKRARLALVERRPRHVFGSASLFVVYFYPRLPKSRCSQAKCDFASHKIGRRIHAQSFEAP